MQGDAMPTDFRRRDSGRHAPVATDAAEVVTAAEADATAAAVVLVGAGPRAVGWLERLAAARAVALDRPPVVIHLVDPFPAGPGRIWRRAQSPLLKLNSMAEDVTMFTDDSCAVDGPVVPGPSLLEWVEGVREGRI